MKPTAQTTGTVANDVLDMSQYRIDRLPKREWSTTEKWLASLGIPLAVGLFLLFGYLWTPDWLTSFNAQTLPEGAAKVLAFVALLFNLRFERVLLLLSVMP